MSYVKELIQNLNGSRIGTKILVNRHKLNELYYKDKLQHGGNNTQIVQNKYKLEKYLLNQGYINKGNAILILAYIIINNSLQNDKENKYVVLKLSKENDLIKKEYETSQILNNPDNNFNNGFIKYDALYMCPDNTNEISNFKKIHKNTTINLSKPKKICEIIDSSTHNFTLNTPQKSRNTSILEMPYYNLDSLENYKWNLTNINLLQNLIKQVITNYSNAFIKLGFIHKDLYFRNVLINNENGEYKPIIMDMTLHDIGEKYKKDISVFLKTIKTFINEFDSEAPKKYKFEITARSYNNWINEYTLILEKNIMNNDIRDELVNSIDLLQFQNVKSQQNLLNMTPRSRLLAQSKIR
jgi:tRNA A-37 threonylcarbamoyl transferase component Bud32